MANFAHGFVLEFVEPFREWSDRVGIVIQYQKKRAAMRTSLTVWTIFLYLPDLGRFRQRSIPGTIMGIS